MRIIRACGIYMHTFVCKILSAFNVKDYTKRKSTICNEICNKATGNYFPGALIRVRRQSSLPTKSRRRYRRARTTFHARFAYIYRIARKYTTRGITCLVIRRFRQLCAQLPIPRLLFRQLHLQPLDLLHQLLCAGRKEGKSLASICFFSFFFFFFFSRRRSRRRLSATHV